MLKLLARSFRKRTELSSNTPRGLLRKKGARTPNGGGDVHVAKRPSESEAATKPQAVGTPLDAHRVLQVSEEPVLLRPMITESPIMHDGLPALPFSEEPELFSRPMAESPIMHEGVEANENDDQDATFGQLAAQADDASHHESTSISIGNILSALTPQLNTGKAYQGHGEPRKHLNRVPSASDPHESVLWRQGSTNHQNDELPHGTVQPLSHPPIGSDVVLQFESLQYRVKVVRDLDFICESVPLGVSWFPTSTGVALPSSLYITLFFNQKQYLAQIQETLPPVNSSLTSSPVLIEDGEGNPPASGATSLSISPRASRDSLRSPDYSFPPGLSIPAVLRERSVRNTAAGQATPKAKKSQLPYPTPRSPGGALNFNTHSHAKPIVKGQVEDNTTRLTPERTSAPSSGPNTSLDELASSPLLQRPADINRPHTKYESDLQGIIGAFPLPNECTRNTQGRAAERASLNLTERLEDYGTLLPAVSSFATPMPAKKRKLADIFGFTPAFPQTIYHSSPPTPLQSNRAQDYKGKTRAATPVIDTTLPPACPQEAPAWPNGSKDYHAKVRGARLTVASNCCSTTSPDVMGAADLQKAIQNSLHPENRGVYYDPHNAEASTSYGHYPPKKFANHNLDPSFLTDHNALSAAVPVAPSNYYPPTTSNPQTFHFKPDIHHELHHENRPLSYDRHDQNAAASTWYGQYAQEQFTNRDSRQHEHRGEYYYPQSIEASTLYAQGHSTNHNFHRYNKGAYDDPQHPETSTSYGNHAQGVFKNPNFCYGDSWVVPNHPLNLRWVEVAQMVDFAEFTKIIFCPVPKRAPLNLNATTK